MPRRARLQAIAAFLLAVLLYTFFQYSKHQPAIAAINAFADDPYDAVGSFGVQFALFTALICLVRAFRPYPSETAENRQDILFARSLFLTWASVAVVLAADAVAALRYPTLWLGSTPGYELMALLVGMALFTAFVAWFAHNHPRTASLPPSRTNWLIEGGILVLSILTLAFYPQSWRESIQGALLTAFTGTVIFFASVWAWDKLTAPAFPPVFEDFIDDLAALYRWLKSHMRILTPLFFALEKIRDWPVIRWLNPRKRPWNGVILGGILLGLFLALGELTGEGGTGPRQLGRLLTVIAVFVVLEGAGVILGYILLARPLALFQRTSLARPDASTEG